MRKSATPSETLHRQRSPDRKFLAGLARAFGGAIIFTLPLFMTMEMWQLGIVMDRWRLALLLVTMIPVLVGLSHFCGFEPTWDWKDDLVDAFVAYAVAFVAAFIVLALFGELWVGMPLNEAIGKVALQAIPGSVGAVLAEGLLGTKDEQVEAEMDQCSFSGELFLMLAGALFLSLNVAPTEEMILIGYKMSTAQGIGLAVLSLLTMHGFAYAMEFRGQSLVPAGTPHWSLLLRYTIPGYAIALLTSFYLLWTFGRIDDTGAVPVVMATLVLAFPASIGAAAARLIL